MAETITYEYRNNLYVNLTNRCDNDCVFCIRKDPARGRVCTDDLWLEREPSRGEILADLLVRDFTEYRELVFCGYGEPMYRADDIFWLIDKLHRAVAELPPVRVNTNGHASLLLGRDVTPGLDARVDTVCISLDASDAEKYAALARPQDGEKTWDAMLDFAKKAKAYSAVVMTVVDKDLPPEEIEACRALAESLGATLRVRPYGTDKEE